MHESHIKAVPMQSHRNGPMHVKSAIHPYLPYPDSQDTGTYSVNCMHPAPLIKKLKFVCV